MSGQEGEETAAVKCEISIKHPGGQRDRHQEQETVMTQFCISGGVDRDPLPVSRVKVFLVVVVVVVVSGKILHTRGGTCGVGGKQGT